MALKHGNKSYYQVLIDPNRAELIEKVADKEGMRGTAWVRKVRMRLYNVNLLAQNIKLLKPKMS